MGILDIVWEKTVKIIKEKVSQQNFETWIRPIRIDALEGDHATLAVPNRFFRDWLVENFLSLIREAMKSVAGVNYEVQFLVEQENPQDQEKEGKPAPVAEKAAPQKKDRATLNSTLNPNYNFARFVVGASNQFAHAASVAVADQPAKNYNPLFIYGGVGLGKTHLLNAIGLKTMSLFPEMNVVYVSAEVFMNELINSIRYDKMPKFREKFRNIDCLLIDDIQFIAGKERTQEEFFHTFNTLHDAGKQIVVTSDKFPKDIPNLEGRLRSRFEWGLIADIQPPEIETKIAILEKKAQENQIDLPSNVALYIASQAETNIRELEGYLVRIAAYSSLTGREIDLELVKAVLKKLLRQEEKRELTIEEITKTVSGALNIKLVDIKSQKKNKNLVQARQIAMYLAREMTSASFPDIGEKIGGRDHSTVIYAHNKIKKNMETDKTLMDLLEEIRETLLNKR
ncbi:MAG: chromosomal replication initiator protein DnaA [Deltaproteobacteria bacterium]|nr:chromosomal replication initiator protein DnaA [Deltaproteobacteria bacterium]